MTKEEDGSRMILKQVALALKKTKEKRNLKTL